MLGNGGTAISNANVAAAINAISGFSGTVTVAGSSNTAGPTITFGGASALTDVPFAAIVFGGCACTDVQVESVKGSAGVLGSPSGSVATVTGVTDTGYTITYPGLGNVPQPTVTNGTGGTSGTVITGTPGAAGILPTGGTAAIGGLANTGFTVTYAGALAGAQPAGSTVSLLSFTNLTTGTGMFGISTKGGPATNHGTLQATGNTPPTVTVPTSVTIPYRTPFTLTGSATDPDMGQTLTYMWEQNDTGTGTILTNNVKTTGALFRQFGTALDSSQYNVHTIPTTFCSNGENCTTTDPSRTFPDMAQILSNNTNAASGSCPQAGTYLLYPLLIDCYSEFLPTAGYAGPMHFRLTVRDGAVGAGGVDSGNETVNLAPGTGPFLVTSQSGATSYAGLSNQTVTWNVAGTNAAPISTTNVNVLLSTDGGATFPTTLASNVPNNGSANVIIPATTTTTARIEVQPVGNIYFDINDNDFTITQAPQTITFGALANKTFTDPDFNVSATASSGLAVSFTAAGDCTVAGTLVHITGAGSCTITAHQAGDVNYLAAPDVMQTFSIAKHSQLITFPALSKKTYGSPDFDPGATASSGLPITYTVTGSVCSIVANQVHIVGTTNGTCKVTAHQAGDANWLVAVTVARNFKVAAVATKTTLTGTTPVSTGGTITLTATVTSPVSPIVSGSVKFYSVAGNTLLATVPLSGGTASTMVVAPGSPQNIKFYAKYVGVPGSGWGTSTSAKFNVHVTP